MFGVVSQNGQMGIWGRASEINFPGSLSLTMTLPPYTGDLIFTRQQTDEKSLGFNHGYIGQASDRMVG